MGGQESSTCGCEQVFRDAFKGRRTVPQWVVVQIIWAISNTISHAPYTPNTLDDSFWNIHVQSLFHIPFLLLAMLPSQLIHWEANSIKTQIKSHLFYDAFYHNLKIPKPNLHFLFCNQKAFCKYTITTLPAPGKGGGRGVRSE